MSLTGDYTYTTEPRASNGAYDAVMTTVDNGAGSQMYFVTRLGYSGPAPDDQTLDELSEGKARERIAERGFEAGVEERWLYTTFGWEPFDA